MDEQKYEIVTENYDPVTGNVSVAAASENYTELANRHFNNFMNDSTDNFVDLDNIKKAVADLNLNFDKEEITDKISDIGTVIELIKKHNKKEKITYEELPAFIKNIVNTGLAEKAGDAPDFAYLSNKQSRNYMANLVIGMVADKYNKESTEIDLDTMLYNFNKSMDEMGASMSKEFGDLLMSYDEERKLRLREAIDRCKNDGKTEAAEKLQKMLDVIDSAFNLDKFSEFCKYVKIKKFELEKPKKIFTNFNFKYENHKNNINDIQYCPIVLSRHISDNMDDNLKFCIAFCKYCANFSPDNVEEHTFMYYFIKNIILLDRINPKGQSYDSMDEKNKNFYDTFVSNIKKCIDALNNRK